MEFFFNKENNTEKKFLASLIHQACFFSKEPAAGFFTHLPFFIFLIMAEQT